MTPPFLLPQKTRTVRHHGTCFWFAANGAIQSAINEFIVKFQFAGRPVAAIRSQLKEGKRGLL